MNIIGIIPARGNSKGVPGKNKKLLQDKPLIAYSIETALKCKYITRLIVSTDDAEIAEISLKSGAEVPFMRPENLASDDSPTIDTVIHALEYFNNEGNSFDAVCLLQPTVPFRSKADIDGAIEKFISTKADSLISVREIPHVYNPHWAFEKVENSDYLRLATEDEKIIPRRQNLPEAYFRDGSIYLTKSEVVLKEKSLYGKNIAAFQCLRSPLLNIDTEADWQLAEEYVKDYEG